MKKQRIKLSRRVKLGFYGILCLATFGLLSWTSEGSSLFNGEAKQTFEGAQAAPWERVEILEDPHPGIKTEAFAEGGEHVDPLIIKWFGTATPPSRQVMLHCASGFRGKTLPHPILLVHGAGDNANRAWMNPFRCPDLLHIPSEKWGMAQWLSQLGYSVFAVTFAHRQGCNIIQSEQIANAITRIRRILGRESDSTFSIDIIGHSKGNLPIRLYCSNSKEIFPDRPFLTSFRGDVRTYVALGSPMLGMDSSFRYYGFNLLRATMPELKGVGPIATDRMLLNGIWKSFPTESYFGKGNELWPGQAQCLFNLDRDGGIPLGVDSATPFDGNLTMLSLYNGGNSLVLSSQGIDRAIDLGERFMYRLREHGLEPSVRLLVVAGDDPVIEEENIAPTLKWLYIISGFFQQAFSAPSDGAVYLKNATKVEEVLARGAKHLETRVFHLNHCDLIRARKVIQFVDSWLMQS
ncbi:MAG: hypothetical protein HQM08_19105 [Candidatus Riflebacteria bacterium]|nr:hypothetical protein [Candidatus Riflebacteria bacterium]